jgi:hypothetical protein
MQEIAHESEAERRVIEAGLLADLGRPPTAVDRIAIEALTAQWFGPAGCEQRAKTRPNRHA